MTPFSAPTAYPDEPINTPATGLPNQTQQLAQGDLERLERYLPALMEMANRPDSTPSFRNYVRLLRAKVR